MGPQRRRLSFAGAILTPLLVTLAQLPLTAQAAPNLSPPMHMSAWREAITTTTSVVHVFGEVSNTGSDARFVQVTCKIFGDPLETVVQTETTATELDILKQNDSSPFDDIFFNPPPNVDHFSCQLKGGAATSSVANHDFTTTVTSTPADLHVTGTVENNKNLPVDRAKVIFTFYKSGNVVDVESLMANDGNSIAPGLPATSFELDRTANRPTWDAVTAITEGPFPAVQLPASVAFSDQIKGTTSPVNNLVLTNIGTGDLHIATNAVSISGTNAADFAIAQDGCSNKTVKPDATCTVGLTFTPGGLGGRSATVSFSDDAAVNPQTVSLSGNGLSRSAATISPQSLDFGNQVKGTNVTKSITVTSVGPDPVMIDPVGVSGTNAGDFAITGDTCSNQSIAMNATCTVSITFTPAQTGARSASLVITDNGRFAHDPVTLTGNGIPIPPTTAQASFSPTQLPFGSQLVGTSSQTQQVTLSSTGTADLVITSISITGDAASYQKSDTCGQKPVTLHPGQNCTISIIFKPTGTGPHNATLSLVDNAPGNAPTVSLTGTGFDLGSGPTISSWGRGRLDVFMKGADGALWHKYYDSSVGWQGWSSLGAPPLGVTLASDPVAISWGRARIDIFVKGSDSALWHKYYDVNLGGWSIWYSHGGNLTSAPTATSWGYGRLDVFYRGTDNTLRHIFYASFIGVWSIEYSHGGTLASDPSAITWGPGRIDVVARGTDNTLQHNDYDLGRGGWLTSWETVPGDTLVSRPAITTWGPGRLDVFAQGTDASLQHNYFYAGNWQGWTSQGQPPGNQMTSNPGAIAWSYGRLDIFVRGQNATLLHKFYDSSVGWSDWFSESLAPNPG